jgi:large subunit ribosomal protein L15
MPIYRRLPKRGFNNIFSSDFNVVSVGRIQSAIDAGKLDGKATIDVAALKAAGVIRRTKDGVRPRRRRTEGQS